MKKAIYLFLFTLCILSGFGKVFAASEPVYNPEYDSGEGAFYANGTDITIDQNSSSETVITWNGGSQIVPSTVIVFGGGTDGTEFESSNIVMNGGEISSIIGGGASVQEGLPAKVTNVSIIINNGTILNSVVGGGLVYSEVENADIIVNNGLIFAICGGGMASASVDGVYYSVGTEENPEASPNRVENVSIVINGGTINSATENYGLVYGGGQGYSYVGETSLEINNGDLSTAYVTAGGSNGFTGNSNVEINGGNVYLYQSVNRGIVEDALTTVNGGTIQKFYVGGETEDLTVTGTINKAEIALLDGVIENLNAGKSNSVPIVTDESNFIVVKTDNIEIVNNNITSEEIEITYQISFAENNIRLEEGETQNVNLRITTTPIGYERLFNEITYTSSNEEVATVDENGNVKAIKSGEAVITATVLEQQISCNVLVVQESDLALIISCIVVLIAMLILILVII